MRALNSYEENDKVKVKEKKSSSLIEGNIGKAILFFVLPLIAGSLIQQLYVTVDAIIVGRFAGKVGLAAIDSINTLFKFPINFCMLHPALFTAHEIFSLIPPSLSCLQ